MLGVLVCLAGLAAPPQDDGLRGRTIGIVRTRAGKAWAGAHVEFVSRPLARAPLLGQADIVAVTTDARGRFRVLLRKGCAYRAWAWQRSAEHLRATAIATGVVTGVPLRLRETTSYPGVSTIQLEHRDAWRAYEPLRFELVSGDRTFRVELESSADGRLGYVPVPGAEPVLVVRSRDGLPLVETPLRTGREAQVVVDLPEPKLLVVDVRCEGKPVPDAQVWQEYGGLRFERGRTNASGRAFVLPLIRWRSRVARVPGHIGCLASGMAETGRTSKMGPGLALGAKPKDRLPADVRIVCEKGRSIVGRLFSSPGKPLAQARLYFFSPLPTGRQSYSHTRSARVVHTDEHGRFRIGGLHASCAWRIVYMLDAPTCARLTVRGVPPARLAWLARGVKPPREPDIGDFVLSEHPVAGLAVQHPDHRPARAAEIVLGDTSMHPRGGIGVYYGFPFVSDRDGRFRVLLPQSGSFGVLAKRGWLCVAKTLSAETLAKGGETMRLPVSTTIAGRVIDADGKGLAGAVVSLTPMASTGGLGHLRNGLSRTVPLTTNAEGEFSVSVPIQSGYRISASWHGKDGHRAYGSRSVVVGAKPETGLEVLLAKRKAARRR